ncbi:MAG: EAL domain-containing protein [Pseudomonadales bacterium]|nr:EAL domain-containing protein [Pseudomonadales bacterium]MBO6595767.1 EAL domain-containing protein [Pseudomonadales bacterium]MBO6822252.1 EAL domain-containing protein [Pseudomonadales bacterium]
MARLLVVEDEVLVARDIQGRLQRLGYEVVGSAAKGEEAVEMARNLVPDLVLMDINLRGDIDGIEAAIQINEVESIPIIFCTAYSSAEILERAKITSPFGYVLKPFDNRELEINIQIALFKHRVERDLAETKQNLDATLTNVSDGVIAADDSGRIFLINPIAEKIVGCESGNGTGKNLDEILRLEGFEAGQASINLMDPETFAFWKQFSGIRQRLTRFDGRKVPIELSANFLEEDANLTVITFRDISQQLGYEETIQRNAFFDGLTELPNRALFVDRLEGSINRRKRGGRPGQFSVLFIGLDGFTVINEGFGHDAGDMVINQIGQRIAKTIRPDDTVSRFSGEIFALLLDPVEAVTGSIQACQRILSAVQEPISVQDSTLNITASVGIVVNNGEYLSADQMLQDVDTALHRAKSDTHGSYVVFDNARYEDAVRFIDRKNGMQKAIVQGDFEVHYQPIVSLETGKLAAMEALVRWPHPEEGMVSPAEFIPIAEATGLILPLGEYVLHSVCDQIKRWNDQGLSGFRVAVNFSARQFEVDVAALVRTALSSAGIEPTQLAMEITEGLAMKNVNRNTEMLADIRKLGVNISMDDFGAGYSSFSYLKRFPLTTLKIDRSFIKDIHENEEDKRITRAIIAMGQSLNLATQAKGVENDEQLEILREYGCDCIQGFYYSKPLPASQMTEYLLEGAA